MLTLWQDPRGLIEVHSIVPPQDFDGQGRSQHGSIPVAAVPVKRFPSANHQQTASLFDHCQGPLLAFGIKV
jgi:hypothetical protein